MPSVFGWVDFSEKDREKMKAVIDNVSKDPVDELGIGLLRDAFADYFFPGTSTVQTRARYMLFVPWIYLGLEEKEIPCAQVAKKAREEEIRLIYCLLKSGEDEGVIGKRSKESLVRLPSNIYWNGLFQWGIRLFPGTQEEYHRSLDRFYSRKKQHKALREQDSEEHICLYNWHPWLESKVPKYFPERVKFDLTKEEAKFLKERILQNQSGSLLAWLVNEPEHFDCEYIWEHPIVSSLPSELSSEIKQAHNFSDCIFGAVLLYNLMLAQELKNKELINIYQDEFHQWSDKLVKRWKELENWHNNMDSFWSCSAFKKARITFLTKKFVTDWLDLVLSASAPEKLASNQSARLLIKEREARLKRRRARLNNPRNLELWNGSSGLKPLDYRWRNAAWMLKDILSALGKKGE